MNQGSSEGLLSSIRIAYESFAYRVRKREANNLVVTFSMMVAFGLSWPDLIYRGIFALVLNMYIYLINDVFDVHVDLASPGKDQVKTIYISKHPKSAWLAVVLEALILIALSIGHYFLYQNILLILAFVINTVVIIGYSRWLKRIPFLDVGIMAVAGASTTMMGVPTNALGYSILGFLAILCASYQIIQLVRDMEVDQKEGVHTSAVLLGAKASRIGFIFLVIGGAIYGILLLKSFAPLGLLAGIVFPLTPEKAERSWDYARLVFGLVWLAILGEIFFNRIY